MSTTAPISIAARQIATSASATIAGAAGFCVQDWEDDTGRNFVSATGLLMTFPSALANRSHHFRFPTTLMGLVPHQMALH